jgi:predicted amidohydrolase YtcJ
MSNITFFTAKRIHTMSESQPHATAVAVRNGIILEAGTLETLTPWLDSGSFTIDERFADKILMPGFIDPHLHPFIGAILLPSTFITAFEWDLPGQTAPAVRGAENYLNRLRSLLKQDDGSKPVFLTWGYHQIWHGAVTRQELNAISDKRPIVVWHRSFHEVILNDAAIDFLKIDRDVMKRHPQINEETGRFSEMGGMVALEGLKPILFSPDWFGPGLSLMHQIVHKGGHTTVADMSWGMFDYEMEWATTQQSFNHHTPPYRMLVVPRGLPEPELSMSADQAFERVDALTKRESYHLFFNKRVKFFADGAFFSELMQMADPGYIDGHHGEWMTAPDQFREIIRPYWQAGYAIHVHCTGDLGLEMTLDVLEAMQSEKPRFDHRFTIEHFGVSNEEQVRRIKTLGANVSANVYYLHELGEAYWKKSIGYERASQMARLGTLKRHNVPFALHSDFTMAPASPLTSAWVAVTRASETGDTLGVQECISVHDAIRAITIEAAYIIGMEDKIGSIRSGKNADFTILDEDPYEVEPERLKDIRVHATVFQGAVHEISE